MTNYKGTDLHYRAPIFSSPTHLRTCFTVTSPDVHFTVTLLTDLSSIESPLCNLHSVHRLLVAPSMATRAQLSLVLSTSAPRSWPPFWSIASDAKCCCTSPPWPWYSRWWCWEHSSTWRSTPTPTLFHLVGYRLSALSFMSSASHLDLVQSPGSWWERSYQVSRLIHCTASDRFHFKPNNSVFRSMVRHFQRKHYCDRDVIKV